MEQKAAWRALLGPGHFMLAHGSPWRCLLLGGLGSRRQNVATKAPSESGWMSRNSDGVISSLHRGVHPRNLEACSSIAGWVAVASEEVGPRGSVGVYPFPLGRGPA